jgi:hypothetical protein
MIVATIFHHHQIHLGTYFAFFYFNYNFIDFLRKRGRYSNDFKNKVLIYASTNGNDETLEKYNIDRRRLKEWQNKKEKIENMKYKRNTFKVKSEKDFSRYPLMDF